MDEIGGACSICEIEGNLNSYSVSTGKPDKKKAICLSQV